MSSRSLPFLTCTCDFRLSVGETCSTNICLSLRYYLTVVPFVPKYSGHSATYLVGLALPAALTRGETPNQRYENFQRPSTHSTLSSHHNSSPSSILFCSLQSLSFRRLSGDPSYSLYPTRCPLIPTISLNTIPTPIRTLAPTNPPTQHG